MLVCDCFASFVKANVCMYGMVSYFALFNCKQKEVVDAPQCKCDNVSLIQNVCYIERTFVHVCAYLCFLCVEVQMPKITAPRRKVYIVTMLRQSGAF